MRSEDLVRLLLNGLEVLVELIDLVGDAGVTACGALELFSEVKLQLHLGTILIDDASAPTVNTHHG